MPTGVMVISAMVIPVPPASRLGLVREEYAAEQNCHERTNDDAIIGRFALSTGAALPRRRFDHSAVEEGCG
jgi:hypothetical protein